MRRVQNNIAIGKADWNVFSDWNFPRLPYMARLQNNIHEVVNNDSLNVGMVRVNSVWQSGGSVQVVESEGVQLMKEFADIRGLRPEWIKMFAMDYVAARHVCRRFAAGLSVVVKDVIWYRGTLYRCIQAHTTQADWTPDITTALWGRIPYPGQVAEWSWYDTNTLYLIIEVGAKVQHNSIVYMCINPTFSWIEPGSASSHFAWEINNN
jgi:hypothetical protein